MRMKDRLVAIGLDLNDRDERFSPKPTDQVRTGNKPPTLLKEQIKDMGTRTKEKERVSVSHG